MSRYVCRSWGVVSDLSKSRSRKKVEGSLLQLLRAHQRFQWLIWQGFKSKVFLLNVVMLGFPVPVIIIQLLCCRAYFAAEVLDWFTHPERSAPASWSLFLVSNLGSTLCWSLSQGFAPLQKMWRVKYVFVEMPNHWSLHTYKYVCLPFSLSV
jgi:hypothetical protein